MSPKVANLVPCDDSEYAEFVSLQVIEYASQLVRAGEVTPELSTAAAQERLQDLRADRLRGAQHDFFIARSAVGAMFDWNRAARCLYESHGYQVAREFAADARFRKRLSAG
jgi:hypothetical protein